MCVFALNALTSHIELQTRTELNPIVCDISNIIRICIVYIHRRNVFHPNNLWFAPSISLSPSSPSLAISFLLFFSWFLGRGLTIRLLSDANTSLVLFLSQNNFFTHMPTFWARNRRMFAHFVFMSSSIITESTYAGFSWFK